MNIVLNLIASALASMAVNGTERNVDPHREVSISVHPVSDFGGYNCGWTKLPLVDGAIVESVVPEKCDIATGAIDQFKVEIRKGKTRILWTRTMGYERSSVSIVPSWSPAGDMISPVRFGGEWFILGVRNSSFNNFSMSRRNIDVTVFHGDARPPGSISGGRDGRWETMGTIEDRLGASSVRRTIGKDGDVDGLDIFTLIGEKGSEKIRWIRFWGENGWRISTTILPVSPKEKEVVSKRVRNGKFVHLVEVERQRPSAPPAPVI